ncbi:malonyl-CoA decarboxylase domain-containing protein [Sandarakinorhabdus glacialis]|uniref:malonyl-CoA decarboxylase domain-containing protein n=1 Tax=Sandarakinorhabdus glacialis TaxID=1614636 RepID=UPI00166CC4A0
MRAFPLYQGLRRVGLPSESGRRGSLHIFRRSYGFFNPAFPDEPLIFVEVLLTDEPRLAARCG